MKDDVTKIKGQYTFFFVLCGDLRSKISKAFKDV